MAYTVKSIQKQIDVFIKNNLLLKRVVGYVRVYAKKISLEQLLFIIALLFSVFFIIGLYT